jgi:hypothetical protein
MSDSTFDSSVEIKTLLLLLIIAFVGFASYFSCEKLLNTKVFAALPRPLVCAVLWAITTTLFVLASFKYLSNSDWREACLLIPVAAVFGMFYGGCFLALKAWLKLNGTWWQRLLLGAAIGLLSVLGLGVLLYTYIDSGSRSYWMIFMIYIVWMIPALATAGLLTPQRALIHLKDDPVTLAS